MPINFLGEEKKPKRAVAEEEVLMHLPEKEVSKPREKAKKEVQKEPVPKKTEPIAAKPVVNEVNLAKSFKSYLLKKRLLISLLVAALIAVALIIAVYFLFFYHPAPRVVINTNVVPAPVAPVINQPIVLPEPVLFCGDAVCNNNETCGTCSLDCGACPEPIQSIEPEPIVVPAPEPIIPAPVLPLPDTELAPLRGALVKFSNNSNLYLIDYNGELRVVDLATVYFANGQKVSDISKKYIYLLSSNFADVRQGKLVKGRVDWDPRILSPEELAPFIK